MASDRPDSGRDPVEAPPALPDRAPAGPSGEAHSPRSHPSPDGKEELPGPQTDTALGVGPRDDRHPSPLYSELIGPAPERPPRPVLDNGLQPPGQAPREPSEPPATVESPSLNEQLMQKLLNMLHSLRTIASYRTQAVSERDKCQRERSYRQHVQYDLMNQLQNMTTPDPVNTAMEQLRQLENDLLETEDKTTKLDMHLNGLEYRLAKMEDDFVHHFSRAFSLPLDIRGPAQTPPHVRESYVSSSSENQDPLLSEYYTTSSQIPILRERLLDLQHTHGEERVARETRANLGESVSPPDLEFYSEYNRERDALLRELQQMQEEAEQLRGQCIERELLPGLTKTSIKETEQPVEDGDGAHSDRRYPPLFQQALSEGTQSISISQLAPGLGNKREAISDWLQRAPDTEVADSQASEKVEVGSESAIAAFTEAFEIQTSEGDSAERPSAEARLNKAGPSETRPKESRSEEPRPVEPRLEEPRLEEPCLKESPPGKRFLDETPQDEPCLDEPRKDESPRDKPSKDKLSNDEPPKDESRLFELRQALTPGVRSSQPSSISGLSWQEIPE